MATTQMPRSILKKTSYPATDATSKADRDRELALFHARIIQQRKDTELEILLSTETLSEYPLATFPYHAGNPSPTDTKAFKNSLRPFQPRDYDDLITERNTNGRCGYTLCPDPPHKETGGGKYRVIGKNGRAKDFRVVEKKELEKFCSEACARRALYVRVQLSETPAWERVGAENAANIDLLDEPKADGDTIVGGFGTLQLDGGEGTNKQDAADLALERGDRGLAARNGLVDVKILEKDVKRIPAAPTLDEDLADKLDTMHLQVEGHTITFGSNRHRRHEEEEEDSDWKL